MRRINIKYLVISLILVITLTLSSGCFYIQSEEPSSPVQSEEASSPAPINPAWKPPSTETQTSVLKLPGIADVVAVVKPSVVAINTETITFDFFNQPLTEEGAGSGWILDKDGIIVTNNHVVEGAETITVTLDDGRTFPAEASTVFTDPLSDLAILEIDAQNLPALELGDSSTLRIGDWVVAIGNALGRGTSAKEGIISLLGVSLPVDQDQTLYNLIETSAAINPGNSGGPLVNMAGEVIGITSAKLAAVEVEGIGYAISTETAIPIIESLVQTGYVIRPWLGVTLYTVDEGISQQFDLAVNEGVLITGVVEGSPAETAKLEAGDIIVAMNDKDTPTADDLIIAIRDAKIGEKVEITFWRGTAKLTTEAFLAERPQP